MLRILLKNIQPTLTNGNLNTHEKMLFDAVFFASYIGLACPINPLVTATYPSFSAYSPLTYSRLPAACLQLSPPCLTKQITWTKHYLVWFVCFPSVKTRLRQSRVRDNIWARLTPSGRVTNDTFHHIFKINNIFFVKIHIVIFLTTKMMC